MTIFHGASCKGGNNFAEVGNADPGVARSAAARWLSDFLCLLLMMFNVAIWPLLLYVLATP